jgi:rhamnosyltransferase subunit B
VILATVGSLGDLHPFIAVGLALRAAGVDVVIACAAEYREKVQSAGLTFRAVRPSFDDLQHASGMNRQQLTEALLARDDFLFRELIVPSARASYEDMLSVLDGADLVLTSSLAFGARLAAERLSIAWIAVVLQPMMFLSAYDPPVIARAEWLTRVLRHAGPVVTGAAVGLVKRAMGRMLRPIDALRREIGLAPASHDALFDGQFSSSGAIGLYSSVLGGVQPDFPTPTTVVGFAQFDSQDGAASVLAPELNEFLEAGSAPLVFTLGSLIVNSPGQFYRESLAASRLLGERAVLLVGESADISALGVAGKDVHVCAYAPHSLLFPRGLAVVHQGGVGTLAQALRSGRPQLIVPFYGDQTDNAARAVRLGVARSLKPRRYGARTAAGELAALVSVERYRLRAADVRGVLAAENGAARAAAVVIDRLHWVNR